MKIALCYEIIRMQCGFCLSDTTFMKYLNAGTSDDTHF